MKRRGTKSSGPVPLNQAVPAPQPDRLVDGVPVKTYRGASLAEVAPLIRAELGDGAMILRQREGVTGGIGGFFAKRCVEIDVALVGGSQAGAGAGSGFGAGAGNGAWAGSGAGAGAGAGAGRIDTLDGPAIGPGGALSHGAAPQIAPVPLPTPGVLPGGAPGAAVPAPFGAGAGAGAGALAEGWQAAPPVDTHPAMAPRATGPSATFEPLAPPPMPLGTPVQPTAPFPPVDQRVVPQQGAFQVTAPSVAQAQSVEAALRAEQERAQAIHASTTDASLEAPFDPGQSGVIPAPVPQTGPSFEEHLRHAGLMDPTGPPDPAHVLAPLHQALVRRGLPEQIASPVADDTLCHRAALEPGADLSGLLAAELARRIPTAPLVGRAGQAVAFVGSSGVGKTRAIARLAAAYGAASRIPVACVTLQDSGGDGLLAAALAPFGVAVHAAPDAPRALDRITALRRHSLVLVDTPGVSPSDRAAVDRLASTLELLELDTVALCLPVTLAAPIARRVLRALRPLRPTVLVATHADEADLLGGVVAVAIDRRVPLAYVSEGAGRGSIVGADAHRIATELVADASHLPPAPPPTTSGRTVPVPQVRRPLDADPASRPSTPTVDIAAGAGRLAPPWVSASLADRRR